MSRKCDSRKRRKFFITFSICASLFLATILIVIWAILLTDKSRSTYERSDAENSEIIKKNYIKGFENIESTGEFTFRFREDEINDLLYDGVQTLDDKHISNIYYEKGENDFHTFYVDLKKMPVKTRVVITTYVGESDSNTINLNIYSVKIGKVDASKYLVRKGYLTEEFINKYFEACNLPISYDESAYTFQIKATSYISMFPKGDFANLLWNEVLEIPQCYSVNTSTLGLNVLFSKLRTTSELSKKTFETPLPDFYQELKDSLEAIDFSAMSIGESKTAYSISLDDFDHLLTESLPANKEEVSSSLLSSKATFELVGASTKIKNDGNLDIAFLYSLNGYLVDVHQDVEFYDYSSSFFNAELSVTNTIIMINQTKEEYKTYFSPVFEQIYKNIQEKHANFFNFSDTSKALEINLEAMNKSHVSSNLRDAYKSLEINSSKSSLDFIVVKTIYIW